MIPTLLASRNHSHYKRAYKRPRLHSTNFIAPQTNQKANLQAYLSVLQTWLGRCEPDDDDLIINIYNSQKEPDAYKMQLSDPWCQATVSAAAYVSGNQYVVPNIAYCPFAVNWFKSRKQWVARGSTGYDPQIGDIIYYDWNGDGTSEHVGTVISRNNDIIVVREGNHNHCLSDREISIYSADIMGYGHPDWNGEAGQKDLPIPEPEIKYDIPKIGSVNTNVLNVRCGPGTDYSQINQIKLDEQYKIYGETDDWYYIDIDGNKGYVFKTYITLV